MHTHTTYTLLRQHYTNRARKANFVIRSDCHGRDWGKTHTFSRSNTRHLCRNIVSRFPTSVLFRNTTSKNLESSTVFNQRCNAATHLSSILLPSFVTAVASQSSSSINAACCCHHQSAISHQPSRRHGSPTHRRSAAGVANVVCRFPKVCRRLGRSFAPSVTVSDEPVQQ